MSNTAADAAAGADHDASAGAVSERGDHATLALVYSERQCPFDPSTELARLRDAAPLSRIDLPDSQVGWLITNYELARTVMGDQRFTRLGLTSVPADQHASFMVDAVNHDSSFPEDARSMIDAFRADGNIIDAFRNPDVLRALHEHPMPTLGFFMHDPLPHNRLRRIAAPHFAVRRLESYREPIERIVADRLDEMTGHGASADLFEDFAQPVASLVTCMILGIPTYERGLFEQLSTAREDPNATVEDLLVTHEAYRQFARRQIERQRVEPVASVLSGLIADGKMSDEELEITAVDFADAAHRTTSATITLAVATLLQDRNRWESLKSESAPPIGQVVEELLRYNSLVQWNVRMAHEDVELHGTLIREGETVVVSLPTANRDPKAFSEPDQMDPTRPGAGTHVGFGYGIHQCLGQNLARLTVGIALSGLVDRFPDLDRVDPGADLPWTRSDSRVFHPERLPVTW